MKKVATYVLFGAFFLNITSCDFFRKVAGRPTSDIIAYKSMALEQRRQQIRDSLDMVAALEKSRRDSLAVVGEINALGVKLSDVFYFGDPIDGLQYKYHLVMGVYRTNKMAQQQIDALAASGYQTYTLLFKGGVQAVVLERSDDISVIASTLKRAKASGVCPKDVWVHVNNKK